MKLRFDTLFHHMLHSQPVTISKPALTSSNHMTPRFPRRSTTSPVVGTTSSTGSKLYGRILRIWQCIALSIFLDPFIYRRHVSIFTSESALYLAVLFSLIILPTISQKRFHNFLHGLRKIQKRGLSTKKSTLALLGTAVGVSALVSKLLFAAHLPLVPALLVLSVIVLASIRVSRKAAAQIESDREKLKREPVELIRRWEDQLVVLCLVPMVVARMVGLVGALQIVPPGTLYSKAAPFSLLSFLLLAMLKPHRSVYSGFCQRCKQPVPVVMASLDTCYRCDKRNFGASSR